jgi:valyl-tRNA synthetase
LTISSQIKRPQLAGTAVVKEIEIYLPLKDLINLEQEQKRLSKEIAEVERSLERTNKKLKNKDFLTKAPPEVVEKEKKRQEELKAIRKKLKDNVRYLSSSNRSRPQS